MPFLEIKENYEIKIPKALEFLLNEGNNAKLIKKRVDYYCPLNSKSI